MRSARGFGEDDDQRALGELGGYQIESRCLHFAGDGVGANTVHSVGTAIRRFRCFLVWRCEIHHRDPPTRTDGGNDRGIHRHRISKMVIDVAEEQGVAGAVGKVGSDRVTGNDCYL